MTPDYHLCDVCGAKTDPKTQRIFFHTHNTYDGVETVPDGSTFDLCGPCCIVLLKRMAKGSEQGLGELAAPIVVEMQRQHRKEHK